MMRAKNITCSQCGRKFATAAALKQHSATKHGARAVPPTVPRAQPGPKPQRVRAIDSSQNMVLTGSDLIGQATLQDTTPVGTLILAWDINPNTLAGTRVHQFGQVFTRWRPRRLCVTLVPGAGNYTPGSYAMGWVADPKFSLGSADSRTQRVVALRPSLLASFGASRSLNIPCDTTQKWYMCDPSLGAESDHGMVVCCLAARCGGQNISVNIRLDWTVEFSSPDMPSATEDLEIYPDPDWIPIFTDSVSDWASGTKLTFKAHYGGSVVPFVGIRDNVVYKPTKGVTVPYVKADNTTANCEFFARIGGALYPNGLACFATEQDAKDYLKNRDTAKVIAFKSAGGFVTPQLPTFKGSEVEAEALISLRHTIKTPSAVPRSSPSLNFARSTAGASFPMSVNPAFQTARVNFEMGDKNAPCLNLVRKEGEGPSFAAARATKRSDSPPITDTWDAMTRE